MVIGFYFAPGKFRVTPALVHPSPRAPARARRAVQVRVASPARRVPLSARAGSNPLAAVRGVSACSELLCAWRLLPPRREPLYSRAGSNHIVAARGVGAAEEALCSFQHVHVPWFSS